MSNIGVPFDEGDQVELLDWVYDHEGRTISSGTVGTVRGKPFGSAYTVVFSDHHNCGVLYALVSERKLRKHVSLRNRAQIIYNETQERAKGMSNKSLLHTYEVAKRNRDVDDDDSWYVYDAYRDAVLGRMDRGLTN